MGDNYDSNAARDAGYAAGAAEGDYNRAGQDVRQDADRVEQMPGDAARDTEQSFDNGVKDVKDVPSDIGGAIGSAAKWVGDKIGATEGEGRKAEGDVDQFGQGVDNSYDQGQQQGQQQGF